MTRASLATIGIPVAFLLVLQALVPVWHSGAATSGNASHDACARPDFDIIFSDPPDGYADPRMAEDALGQPIGITTVQVTFNAPITLDPACVRVLSTAASAPGLVGISGGGNTWDIELDRPIPAGAATAVVFFSGATSVVLHAHPGDVNGDGVTDPADVAVLQQVVADATTAPEQHDVNRDGVVDGADVALLEDMLESDGVVDWAGDEPNRVYCCCHDGVCSIYIGSLGCTDGDLEVNCPCAPNPCPDPPFENP